MRVQKMLRVFLLGAFGFAIGVLGISTTTATSPLKDFLSFVAGKPKSASLASMTCAMDTRNQQEEVYFISCGGIY